MVHRSTRTIDEIELKIKKNRDGNTI
jgi:hypothetical protein